jgi:hypothetical protein
MVRIHSSLNIKASDVAHKILSFIGQVKGDSPRLPARYYLWIEARAHNNLGCTKEAFVHFEKELKLREAIDNAVGGANAKFSMLLLQSQ